MKSPIEIILFLKKNDKFSVENRRNSPKIVIITSNPQLLQILTVLREHQT
jgi:hypothetical protein